MLLERKGIPMTYTLKELTDEECRTLLGSSRFGHLACCNDGRPYVVPIYFVFDQTAIYSFSMPGKKIDWMWKNSNVCLQIDVNYDGQGWGSVIAEGRFEEYPDAENWHKQRLHAWSMLQAHPDWWEIGALKPHELPISSASPHIFYAIIIEELRGRRARTVREP